MPKTIARFSPRPIQLRVTDEMRNRIRWAAEQRGISNAEFCRLAITKAMRGVKPQAESAYPIAGVTDAEWQSWEKAAAKLDVDVPEYIRRALNFTVAHPGEPIEELAAAFWQHAGNQSVVHESDNDPRVKE
jgi:hypothetical protein